MNIPKLDPVSRNREYNSYSGELRSQVVDGWLFQGKSHRTLDKEMLGLDPLVSKGYQSMNILHHLGLKKPFRGIFDGWSKASAIKALTEDLQDFRFVLAHLDSKTTGQLSELSTLINEEEEDLKKSRADTSVNRRKRIAASSVKPPRIRVYSYTYRRNMDIVVEALDRANGVCEKCKYPAPFMKITDGSPYLEVHHIKPLSNGGDDSLENVLALCPNCHRQHHHGKI